MMATQEQEKELTEAPEPEGREDAEDKASVEPEEGGVKVKLAGTRRERREEYRRERESRSTYTEELRRANERSDRFERELSEMRQLLSRQLAQPRESPQQQGGDPYTREIENIRQEQESIQLAMRSGAITSQGELEGMRKRFYALEERRQDLRDERLERRISGRIPQPQPEGAHEEAVLRAEFPKVVANQQAMAYAMGIYYQLKAELPYGEQPTIETSREAMRRAAERFNLAAVSRPAPTAAQQARYGAVPAQAGTRSASRVMRLNRDQMKMALAAYPHLGEEDAYAKWAQMFAATMRQGEPQE